MTAGTFTFSARASCGVLIVDNRAAVFAEEVAFQRLNEAIHLAARIHLAT